MTEVTIDAMNEVIALFDAWIKIKGNPHLICPAIHHMVKPTNPKQ